MHATTRALLGIAALAATASASFPALAEKHALIVSINEYALPQWKLRGAVNDGRNIEGLLKGTLGYRPEQIRTLYDQAATRNAVLSTFKTWLVDQTRPGDEVFFYFSGHGHQAPDLDGDEEDGLDETLVAADSEPDGKGGVTNMILDDELGRLLDQLEGRQVTLVIDSCHSGTMTRAFGSAEGERSLPFVPGEPPPAALSTRAVKQHREEKAFVDGKPGRTAWTAVAPYQKALEEVRAQPITGVFTNRFIRGLAEKRADANGDGVVTAAELHQYVQKESDAYCKSMQSCQAGLTPTLEASTAALNAPITTSGGGVGVGGGGQAPATPQPRPQPTLQNAATGLLNNDNQGGVTIEVLPGSSVRVGQAVRFRVTSQTEGSLVVLDVNAAGQLVQIFPNTFSQAQNRTNRIYPGRPLTIPDPTYGFDFTASEPVGEGLLIALVIQDPIELSGTLDRHRDLEPVAAPVDYMAQIADKLRRPFTQGATTRIARWSMTSTRYRIQR